jgi:dTDP-L-rhamnose 4-epimerase
MKVLVTGGAGFIGSHIIDALVARGDEVLCIDSLDPGVHHAAPSYLSPSVDYCFVDLRHWQPDERFADIEGVVHLAALGGVSRASKEPGNVIGANATGTARLVEAIARWPKLRVVVHASSFSVYGSNYEYRCSSCGTPRNGDRRVSDLEAGQFEVLCEECGAPTTIQAITESAVPNPLEGYGASKYMQELCYRGFTPAPVHIMRFSSAYGKRLRLDDGEATIIAKLAGWIQSGKTPSLFEDGEQIRDWVYVGDIVDTTLALLATAAPTVVNVCSGKPTTLKEACTILAATLEMDVSPHVAGGFRPGDMRHCLGDPTRLRALIGREPTSFLEGARLAFV